MLQREKEREMSPSAGFFSSVSKQAEQLRIDGNNLFKKARFGAAIDAYTQAITLCPNVPVYWTNRALCHCKRSDWARVEEDCRRAIELDSKSIKAHCMLSHALLWRQQYTQAISEVEKALDLARDAYPKGHMVEEIRQQLAKVKYQAWEHASTKRSWELQCLKEACESALREKHFLDSYQMEGFIEDANASHLAQLEALGRVFNKAAEDDVPIEVPDYLCCNITLDIFCDPVITPSGLSYERAAILEHLEKVGKFDPVTRKPLDPSQLIPNLAIKQAVQAFLDKHGWAYRHSFPLS